MSYTRVQIANCHLASIRKAPWNVYEELDIIGYKKGPRNNSSICRQGEFIDVDLNNFCYDWRGRKYYRVRSPKGWIFENAIDLGGVANGDNDSAID